MPFTFVSPFAYVSAYFLGGGRYPSAWPLRSPLGRVTPTLYSHHDVFTVNEVFCRLDYGLAPEAEIVVDVGSNIGISALYFLTRSPSLRCYLFEPVPRNVERLRRNLLGFEPRYELETVAVGDLEGTVEFGLESTGRYGGIGVEATDRAEFQCLHINTVLAGILEREPRIDMLKIDTEGIENRIVAAIDPLLREKIGMIVFETKEPFNPSEEQFSLQYTNEVCRLTNRRTPLGRPAAGD